MTADERAEALEIKVAYLEHQLAELDGLVRELYAMHATTTAALQALREQRDESVTIGTGTDRPPHY